MKYVIFAAVVLRASQLAIHSSAALRAQFPFASKGYHLLDAKRAAPGGHWPSCRDDIALDSELVVVPTAEAVAGGGDEDARPEWVYLTECVPHDAAPQWPSRPHKGCSCVTRPLP